MNDDLEKTEEINPEEENQDESKSPNENDVQVNDKNIDQEPEESNESINYDGEYNPEKLKEGFGRNEYAKTIGNENYYKNQREELKKRGEDIRNRQSNDTKIKKGHENENIAADGSNTENKNIIDKSKEKKDELNNKIDLAQNKVNDFKSKAYKTMHPIEAAKAEAKEKTKKKAVNLIASHPLICLLVLIGFILLIVILLVLIALAADEQQQAEDNNYNGESYIDPTYDFSQTIVNINNGSITLETVSIKEYLMGATYLEFYNNNNNLSSSQLLELYKAYMIENKALLLNQNGYSNDKKEISVTSSSRDLEYCDYINGCVSKKDENGNLIYISQKYKTKINGNELQVYDKASSNIQSILEQAYDETKYEIITPKDYSESYTSNVPAPAYNESIKQSWLNYTKSNSTYTEMINNTNVFNNYKIYNLKDYTTVYTIASNSAFWWPIGSDEETSLNHYSNSPMSTNILRGYGTSKNSNGSVIKSDGIVIGPASGTTAKANIVIASKSGEVVDMSNTCEDGVISCNSGGGNYVKIKHNDGYYTVYKHLDKNTIAVSIGDKVDQGQKIGTMGKSGASNSSGDLLFIIMQENSSINPLDKVSTTNSRQILKNTPSYVAGNNNQQTVCLSLKESGFSNNAVAALLANMKAESGFRLGAEGDNGTSYGLCQWHNGRYQRLKNYCGSEYTSASCQIKYLIYELQSGYVNVYQNLQSSASPYDMGYYFCYNFEKPSARDISCVTRGNVANDYLAYVNNNCN